MSPVRRRPDRPVIGWREWVALPDLEITEVKAKIDTGARTSCLHAVHLEPFRQHRQDWIRFDVHPRQRTVRGTRHCRARVLEWRGVRSSSGHREERPVIATRITLGGHAWLIEVTLTSRELLGFRMLLGREALGRRFWVDAGRSFQLSPRRGTR